MCLRASLSKQMTFKTEKCGIADAIVSSLCHFNHLMKFASAKNEAAAV